MPPRIEVVEGDITRQSVDAIVNAANGTLLGGGGVDGAIHRAGGPAILAACRALRETLYPDGLPTGWAAPTTAGDLDARWVIHTVGPVYASDPDPRLHLAQCHASVLRVADHVDAATIAVPAISTGAYGYPVHEAAGVAMVTVNSVPTEVEVVRFVLFGRSTFEEFDRARVAAAALAAAAPADPPEVPGPVEGLPRPMATPDPSPWWPGGVGLGVNLDTVDDFLDLF